MATDAIVVGAHLVLERDGEVLLGRGTPDAEFGAGRWRLPAGRVLDGRARACAARECGAALGIALGEEDLELAHVLHLPADADGPPGLHLFFRARRWSGTPPMAGPHEDDGWRWWPGDALPDGLAPYAATALRVLAAERSRQDPPGPALVPRPASPARRSGAAEADDRAASASPPVRVAAALAGMSLLVTDETGRVLTVKRPSHDEQRWLLPGGALRDTGETPRQAAERALRELGIRKPCGRLLATDWIPRPPQPAKSIHVYDGGVLTEDEFAGLTGPDGTPPALRLITPAELPVVLPERLVPRVRTCLAARAAGAGAVELVNGRPVTESVVAVVHHPDTGELLLYERDEHARLWPDGWSLLGGPVEPGESPPEALRRELFVAAGLTVDDDPSLVERVWDREGPPPQLVTVYALAHRGAAEDLVLGEGRRLRLVDPACLDDHPMPPFLRATLDRWLAARADRDADRGADRAP
ncbi:NUDIX domain-containing protein [Streptantibioticus cattleyicolor]|uniref:NUDIX domain-containing protein n=1 Tax=Streptantibioticus cattleyicolor TaxID=29303 RepID=UPI000213D1FD|nr:NUDIX domain-containing protein [Streptantibioticus cattleyicolor]CCB72050.1 protein of unknown function [Streptantibioticus cattleyicolor NRRL 8057 = DSM 46488]